MSAASNTNRWMLIAGLLMWSHDARALAPMSSVATALKADGDAAIAAGRYEHAVDAYSRALAIESNPALFYNRSRALEALGLYAAALIDLEQFDASAPDTMRQAVPTLPAMLAALRAHVGKLRVVTHVANARIYLDDIEMSSVLEAGTVLDAGEYLLRVEATGHATQHMHLRVEGGAERVVDMVLAPRPELTAVTAAAASTMPMHAPAARANEGPRFYQTWWFWAGVGLLAAGATATAVWLSSPRDASHGDIAPGRVSPTLATF